MRNPKQELKVATTPAGKKTVVEDDSSSPYETESDSDASGGKQPLGSHP
jgi:hypothetical protein